MVAGIYAGNADELSIEATFPTVSGTGTTVWKRDQRDARSSSQSREGRRNLLVHHPLLFMDASKWPRRINPNLNSAINRPRCFSLIAGSGCREVQVPAQNNEAFSDQFRKSDPTDS